MLKIPSDAILEIKGKTKNGFVIPGDEKTIYFNFKDSQTVNDKGEIDEGGNVVGGEEIPGIGVANFVLSTYFFKLFEECLDIPTHMIESDIDNGVMQVKRAKLYGQDHLIPKLHLPGKRLGETLTDVKSGGLEVINRRKFTGSYVREFDDFYDMMPIDSNHPSFVEFTIKNDEVGDPRISRSQLVAEGILTDEQIAQIVDESQRIENLVQRLAKANNFEVIDFKTEHGITNDLEHLLVDEYGTGACRLKYSDDVMVKSPKPFDKVEAFLGADIANDIQNMHLKGLNDKVKRATEEAMSLVLKR